jgi:hypothetical protein
LNPIFQVKNENENKNKNENENENENKNKNKKIKALTKKSFQIEKICFMLHKSNPITQKIPRFYKCVLNAMFLKPI